MSDVVQWGFQAFHFINEKKKNTDEFPEIKDNG